MSADLYEELKPWIGKDQPWEVAVDDVNPAMIRHWCEAMEDGNPLYSDEEYAEKSKYGGIIAPPAMMWTWSMHPMWPTTPMEPGIKLAFDAANRLGFDQVIGTSCEMEWFKPLYPGDRVHYMVRVRDVSPQKTTALGTGYFVTFEWVYANQNKEQVADQRVVMFKYKAGGKKQ